jgi:hypothetical protein
MAFFDPHVADADLLLEMDAELSSRRADRVHAHLAVCIECRTRRDRLARTSTSLAGLSDRYVPEPGAGDPREIFRAKLRLALEAAERAPQPGPLFSIGASRWAIAGLVCAALALSLRPWQMQPAVAPRAGLAVERLARPVAHLTPGAAHQIGIARLCEDDVRSTPSVPPEMRLQVLRSYRMEHVRPDEYELDYLITPELGGATDPRNLWPERYDLPVWHARVKDQLEQRLKERVCAGQLDLAVAQRDIASDWIAAYQKYFNSAVPLAGLATDDDDRVVMGEPRRPMSPVALLAWTTGPRSGEWVSRGSSSSWPGSVRPWQTPGLARSAPAR